MNSMKRDDEPKAVEPSAETSEGAKRLRLSVVRLKKLRSHVKGGGEESPVAASTGNSW